MKTSALFSLALVIAAWGADRPAKPSASEQARAALEKKVSAIFEEADSERYLGMAALNKAFREKVAKTYAMADRLEVYALNKNLEEVPPTRELSLDDQFPIWPYDYDSGHPPVTEILRRVKVPAKDVPTWAAAVAKMVTSQKKGVSPLCHFPAHGIRLIAGGKLLFETSICWGCNNFYFKYSREAEWISMSEDSDDLRKLLFEIMPLPKE